MSKNGQNVKAALSLFLAGLFFGGLIDHVILALMKEEVTPYNVRVGVTGNWLFGLLDLVITAILFMYSEISD